MFYSYFIYLFIYFWLCWVFGSCEGFLQLRQVGATLHRGAGTAPHRGARAFHHRGPSRRGAQAPDAQAQQLWLTGPGAPRHVGSSQTRARTRVPCISRQILNHCATREALNESFKEVLHEREIEKWGSDWKNVRICDDFLKRRIVLSHVTSEKEKNLLLQGRKK